MPLAVSVCTANTATIWCSVSARSAASTAADRSAALRHTACARDCRRRLDLHGPRRRSGRCPAPAPSCPARPGWRSPLPIHRGRSPHIRTRRQRSVCSRRLSPTRRSRSAPPHADRPDPSAACHRRTTSSGTWVGPGECRERRPGMRSFIHVAAMLAAALGVRREKAALSSGCKPHPATAPAGSNRSSHGGNEMAEAFG